MLASLTGRGKSTVPHPSQLGGTVYYRGADEAATRIKAAKLARSKSPSPRSSPTPRGRPDALLEERDAKRLRVASPAPSKAESTTEVKFSSVDPTVPAATLPGTEPAEPVAPAAPSGVQDPTEVDEMRSVTDLILVIHGIGQGVSAQRVYGSGSISLTPSS